MPRRRSELTEDEKAVLKDEMIPEFRHRKWLKTEAAKIWAKCAAGATGVWALVELIRTLWPPGGGGGIP